MIRAATKLRTHPKDGDVVLQMLASARFGWAFGLGFVWMYVIYFLIAFVFESRRPGSGLGNIPVWKDQSRAFIPGDLGLCALLATGWYNWPTVTAGWIFDAWYFVALVVALAVGCQVLRAGDAKSYSPAAMVSPTKLYHDYGMQLVFGAALLWMCIPVYLATPWTPDKWLGVLGLAFWLAGLLYDVIVKQVPHPRQHGRWQPIWR